MYLNALTAALAPADLAGQALLEADVLTGRVHARIADALALAYPEHPVVVTPLNARFNTACGAAEPTYILNAHYRLPDGLHRLLLSVTFTAGRAEVTGNYSRDGSDTTALTVSTSLTEVLLTE